MEINEMSQTYQLSKSGIERLERFKRDALSGAVNISEDYHDDGSILFFTVDNGDSVTCCFVSSKDDIASDIGNQLENTLSGKIEKNKIGYFVDGGFALMKSDITTPAQRALEALLNKQNGDTK